MQLPLVDPLRVRTKRASPWFLTTVGGVVIAFMFAVAAAAVELGLKALDGEPWNWVAFASLVIRNGLLAGLLVLVNTWLTDRRRQHELELAERRLLRNFSSSIALVASADEAQAADLIREVWKVDIGKVEQEQAAVQRQIRVLTFPTSGPEDIGQALAEYDDRAGGRFARLVGMQSINPDLSRIAETGTKSVAPIARAMRTAARDFELCIHTTEEMIASAMFLPSGARAASRVHDDEGVEAELELAVEHAQQVLAGRPFLQLRAWLGYLAQDPITSRLLVDLDADVRKYLVAEMSALDRWLGCAIELLQLLAEQEPESGRPRRPWG
jgi:hypothetical protein